MFERLPLDGTKAAEYLRGKLRDGHLLSLLLAASDRQGGAWEAFVPASRPPIEHDLYAFEFGFAFPSGVDRTGLTPHAALAEALCEMARGSPWAVVAEGVNQSPNDPIISSHDLRMATLNNEVYFVALAEEGPRALEAVIRRASGTWRSAAVLTASSSPSWSNRRLSWEREDLARIATMARAIAVGAYDGEGYVLWTDAGAGAGRSTAG